MAKTSLGQTLSKQVMNTVVLSLWFENVFIGVDEVSTSSGMFSVFSVLLFRLSFATVYIYIYSCWQLLWMFLPRY